MLFAKDANQQYVWAESAVKGEHYICPHCERPVILKHGTKKRTHFAHMIQDDSTCSYGEQMTHYDAKYMLAQQLKADGYEIKIEPHISSINQYPDLLVDEQHVLEIQFSNIPIKVLQQRTQRLMDAGFEVRWVIANPVYYQHVIKLSQYESACIETRTHELYAWCSTSQRLYIYDGIQHVGGNRFYAERRVANLSTLFNQDILPSDGKLLKMSDAKICHYIEGCKRQQSVHQPTLNAKYQLRFTDKDVCYFCGFILPNQLYIQVHPIYWKLQLIMMIEKDQFDIQQLLQLMKPRAFACNFNQDQLIKHTIKQYVQLYQQLKYYSVQKKL
ncbi:competence protein CoiA [Staphylococcus auricularis]|uniref:competence protein CoiA n=1 Tax=Staphylococcus auricularis TaxID=29379 RepID=UPI0031199B92